MCTATILDPSQLAHHDGAVLLEYNIGTQLTEWAFYKYERHPFFRFISVLFPGGFDLELNGYNKHWRAWSSRPDTIQMLSAEWDAEPIR